MNKKCEKKREKFHPQKGPMSILSETYHLAGTHHRLASLDIRHVPMLEKSYHKLSEGNSYHRRSLYLA